MRAEEFIDVLVAELRREIAKEMSYEADKKSSNAKNRFEKYIELPFIPGLESLRAESLRSTAAEKRYQVSTYHNSAKSSARDPFRPGPKASEAKQQKITISDTESILSAEIFARLGAPLAAEFSLEDLKFIFRKLALTHHPDRFQQSTLQAQKAASLRFSDLKAAYDHLLTKFKS